jgi:hypothetical protein
MYSHGRSKVSMTPLSPTSRQDVEQNKTNLKLDVLLGGEVQFGSRFHDNDHCGCLCSVCFIVCLFRLFTRIVNHLYGRLCFRCPGEIASSSPMLSTRVNRL